MHCARPNHHALPVPQGATGGGESGIHDRWSRFMDSWLTALRHPGMTPQATSQER